MFKDMRKSQRQITDSEAIDLMGRGEYGILSTIGENGYAYGVPLSYVYFNNAVYFHCAIEGNKLENINFNNKISFCVVGSTKVLPDKFSTEYESVILFGKAVEVINEEKKQALVAIIEKYSKNFKEEGIKYIDRAIEHTKVIKIEIERMTGKARK